MGIWQHNDLTIAAGAPDARGNPASYVFDALAEKHVVYRGTDNHLHELWWNSSGWHHNDLTNGTGAPIPGSSLTGYAFGALSEQHVVHLGLFDSHIHELWWNAEGWHHRDLTTATGAPAADFDSRPAGYAFEARREQHILYSGGQAVQELWWDKNGWHHNNLTIAGGAPTSGRERHFALGDPVGYVFDALGEQHVIYRDTEVIPAQLSTPAHVHELWWNSDGWHHKDLNIAAGSPAGAASDVLGNPAAYAFEAQRTQHVVYRGLDDHVHELWWDSNGWHYNDLTIAADAPTALNNPAGYMFNSASEQHVVYQSHDNHIHELWWNLEGWHHKDLTLAAGAPLALGDPVGYVFDAQRTQHVFYLGVDNHIHELRWGVELSDRVIVQLGMTGITVGSP
jgi:hypothetical protein